MRKPLERDEYDRISDERYDEISDYAMKMFEDFAKAFPNVSINDLQIISDCSGHYSLSRVRMREVAKAKEQKEE